MTYAARRRIERQNLAAVPCMIDELGTPATFGNIMRQALAYIVVLEQAGVTGGTAVVVVGSPSRCDLKVVFPVSCMRACQNVWVYKPFL